MILEFIVGLNFHGSLRDKRSSPRSSRLVSGHIYGNFRGKKDDLAAVVVVLRGRKREVSSVFPFSAIMGWDDLSDLGGLAHQFLAEHTSWVQNSDIVNLYILDEFPAHCCGI